MSQSSDKVKQWRLKTKLRLLEAMGGKCVICNYSKCEGALDFHHIDPSTKEFALGAARGNIKSWSRLVSEVKKCVILCCRCHREYHEGLVEIPNNLPTFNPIFENYRETERLDKMNECPVCGKKKNRNNVTCSEKCAHIKNRKVNWDSVDLKSLLDSHSMVAIGKMLGVSDNAIRKRAKVLGLVGE